MTNRVARPTDRPPALYFDNPPAPRPTTHTAVICWA